MNNSGDLSLANHKKLKLYKLTLWTEEVKKLPFLYLLSHCGRSEITLTKLGIGRE